LETLLILRRSFSGVDGVSLTGPCGTLKKPWKAFQVVDFSKFMPESWHRVPRTQRFSGRFKLINSVQFNDKITRIREVKKGETFIRDLPEVSEWKLNFTQRKT